MKKLLLAVLFGFGVTVMPFSQIAHAQTAVGGNPIATSAVASNTSFANPAHTLCSPFTRDLYIGANNSSDVIRLQSFLQQQGYFSATPIGIFGPLTFSAVQHFQSAHGISATGYVGPITRGYLGSSLCGNPTPTPTGTVSIQTLYPTSGQVGNQVTIVGHGFTNSNTVLFGGGAITNLPITSTRAIMCTNDPSCVGGIQQTITFTIPSTLSPNCAPNMMCAMYMRLVTPGTYTVAVQNSNGTSNSVNFEVTSGSSTSGNISISGVSGPAQLSLNQVGTWTVSVANTGTSSNLHYSVVWGDENSTMPYASTASMAGIQSSATFTHAYSQTGTFTPVFTVSNDAGQSATVSETVHVVVF